MANIKFIREYKSYDGETTIYDIIYNNKMNSFYIGEGSKQCLPKTAINYMEQAKKIKIQYDKFHGREKIYTMQ